MLTNSAHGRSRPPVALNSGFGGPKKRYDSGRHSLRGGDLMEGLPKTGSAAGEGPLRLEESLPGRYSSIRTCS